MSKWAKSLDYLPEVNEMVILIYFLLHYQVFNIDKV